MPSEQADSEAGTNIKCEACGHVRETTEAYPTLVTCEACGSRDIHYVEAEDAHVSGDA